MKGVIPNESPASWPQAALRAQAIASRSYALSVQVHGNGFDLYDDTASQVYKGLDSETAASNEAAEATRGEVSPTAARSRKPTSPPARGHTESVQTLLRRRRPLPGRVPDPYDGSCPLHTWTLEFSGPEISAGSAPISTGA